MLKSSANAQIPYRATEAERRTGKTNGPELKSNLNSTERWRRLAESYQFAQRVPRFLALQKIAGSMPARK